jgi:hypothetical protein
MGQYEIPVNFSRFRKKILWAEYMDRASSRGVFQLIYLDFLPFLRSVYVLDISRTILIYPRTGLRFALFFCFLNWVDYATVMRWIRTGLLEVETKREGKRNRYRIRKDTIANIENPPDEF